MSACLVADDDDEVDLLLELLGSLLEEDGMVVSVVVRFVRFLFTGLGLIAGCLDLERIGRCFVGVDERRIWWII